MIDLAKRYRPLRILCVEEDDLERKLMQACLDVIEAEAIFAPTAAEAIAYFQEHPVDMVFIDIDRHAPGELGGYRRMRAVKRRGPSVPIIAITDNDRHWTEAAYREAGFDHMFPKPIEPTRLFHIIDEVLQAHDQPPLLAPECALNNAHLA